LQRRIGQGTVGAITGEIAIESGARGGEIEFQPPGGDADANLVFGGPLASAVKAAKSDEAKDC
jgi:hypothetical protein